MLKLYTLRIVVIVITSQLLIPLASIAQAPSATQTKPVIQLSLNENPNGPAHGVTQGIEHQMATFHGIPSFVTSLK